MDVHQWRAAMRTSKNRKPPYLVLLDELFEFTRIASVRPGECLGHAVQEWNVRHNLGLLGKITIPRQAMRNVIRQLKEIKAKMPGEPRQVMVQEVIDDLRLELEHR